MNGFRPPVDGRLAPLPDRIEGLDVGLALHNVGGEPRFLRQVLERFVEAYRGGAPALLEPPAGDTWQPLCHSIRGAASMIGARPIADRATALEDAMRLRESDPARTAAAARGLHEALKQFSLGLAAALAAAPPSGGGTVA